MEVNRVQVNILTEPTTDQQRGRLLRRGLLIVLGVSLVFQIVGFAAPGWLIYSTDVASTSTGLFYRKFCTNGNCETRSYIKMYADSMEKAGVEEKIHIRHDFCFGVLREMLGSIVAWILCLVTFVFLTYSKTKKKDLRHSLFHLSSMLSVAGVIMGEIIYVHLVEMDLAIKLLEDYYTVEFPYAMVLYMLACVQVFIAVILVAISFKQEIEKPKTWHRGETNPCYVLQ